MKKPIIIPCFILIFLLFQVPFFYVFPDDMVCHLVQFLRSQRGLSLSAIDLLGTYPVFSPVTAAIAVI